VELQAAEDALGFWRWKGFVKCARGMGREIVENDPDDIGLRVMEIDQIAHACGKIGSVRNLVCGAGLAITL
jgi:predicted metal-dependent phosphotriesterase family hydrolase